MIESLLGPMLHLLGMVVVVVFAYSKFKGDVQTQFAQLSGHIDLVKTEIAGTNQRLDHLWNKEHERLRLKVEEMEKRLRDVEKRKVA